MAVRGMTPAAATSLVFAALLLVGHRYLGSRWLVLPVVVAAVHHVLTVARSQRGLNRGFLTSQFLVVMATLLSVVLYLHSSIGSVGGIGRAIRWHLAGNWTTTQTYVALVWYILIFGLAFAATWVVIRVAWKRTGVEYHLLPSLLAASAVYVGCDYVVRRPLYHVLGDPEAELMFFLVGLAGLEFALLLFAAVFVIAVLRLRPRSRA